MSKPEPGQPLKPGDMLTGDWLNEVRDMAAEGVISIDGSSGLEGYSSPSGTSFRAASKLEFWAKITGAPTGSAHPFTRQIDAGTGTFAAGPRTGSAYEVTGMTTTITNKIVRVYWGGRSYFFQYC